MVVMRKCPICGSEEMEFIKRTNLNLSEEMRQKINYPKFHDIVCCDKCGMLFANSPLSKEDIDTYYINCNMYDNIGDVKTEDQLEVCEIGFNALLPYLTDEATIIDVGCGGGTFLKFLKDKGYSELYGLDPSESSVSKLKEEGINGIVGSLYEEIPKEWHGKFDVVVCTSVFEHLLFPDIALKNLTKLVKKEGIVYLVVPNAEGFSKYLREVPNYFNHEHINYFTTKTMDYLCSKNGLLRLTSDEECHRILMPASPEMVIFAIYKFTENSNNNVIDIPDKDGKKSVIEYFTLIEQQQQQNRRRIEELISQDKQIIIWGTGGLSSSLLTEIPSLENKVECFIDNNINKQGTTYWGKEIFGPDVLMSYPDAIIMVCIMINRDSVIKQIQEMNIKNELFLL